jgi:hypothetical protein
LSPGSSRAYTQNTMPSTMSHNDSTKPTEIGAEFGVVRPRPAASAAQQTPSKAAMRWRNLREAKRDMVIPQTSPRRRDTTGEKP